MVSGLAVSLVIIFLKVTKGVLCIGGMGNVLTKTGIDDDKAIDVAMLFLHRQLY